jgi:hypothetical protein
MRFNKTTRIAAAVAVIGAVAAGGAAFTDTTGQPTGQALGYGSTTITGGDITGISYQVSANGTDVDTVTLTSGIDLLTANNGGSASVYLAFNGHGFGTGGDATCVIQIGGNSVICTPKATTTVASVTDLEVAVTNGAANGDTLG